jgi:DNA-binding transcriptional LysR family regulator
LNLSGINLNLLVALNAMLSEKSLTKAANKLNLTQPALSHMLKQLREVFDDELLFKGSSNRMILTPKAKELVEPVKTVLSQISSIFKEKDYFDPGETRINFNIGMSDYASIILLPDFIGNLNNFTENINLNVCHLNNFSSYEDFLLNNLDFAIGFFANSSKSILSQKLFSTELVCVGRKAHPIFKQKKLDLKTFLSYPQIQPVFRKDLNELYTNTIKSDTGKFRKVITTVPHMMVALSSLKNNDFLCVAHRNIVEKFLTEFDLGFTDLPFKAPEMIYSLYWKREDENDAAHLWLKNAIIKSIKSST